MQTVPIQVDPEFQSLIPELSTEELDLLETSILAEGCRDALVTWNGVLIDGHNRYAICQKHNLPFNVIPREFEDRNAAKVWIIRNQFGRRNLTPFVRSELALQLKAAIAAQAKTNQATSTGGANPQLLLNLAKAETPINTRAELAKAADVSGETIRKVETVTNSAPESIKQAARTGAVSVDRAYKLTNALKNAPTVVVDLALIVADDEPEKVEILKRLHKSMGSPSTNGTFQEIADTGGFAYGDEMEKRCNFKAASIEEIYKGLHSIAEYHRKLAIDEKRQRREDDMDAAAARLQVDETLNILEGDMTLLFDHLEDNSVDMFFSDPPYHANKVDTYAELARLAAAKLKPGGLCLAYSGQMHLPQVMVAMGEHLSYWWMFAIRHTGGHLDVWNRMVWNDWKPVLVFAKPLTDGKLKAAPQWTMDFTEGGGRDKRYHVWGQDASEATYWIERLTNADDLICDPYTGGGSIPVACKLTGRRWIGTEINPQYVKEARVRISEVSR